MIEKIKRGKATEFIHEVVANLGKYESTRWEVEDIKDLPVFLSASSCLNFHSPCFS